MPFLNETLPWLGLLESLREHRNTRDDFRPCPVTEGGFQYRQLSIDGAVGDTRRAALRCVLHHVARGPAGGAIFRTDWFREYTELPDKGQSIISLDTAYSVKKTADYSAASVWVACQGKYYLAWMWRERREYPRLKQMTQELYDTWHPDAILVEEKGSGQSLLQSLQQETSLPVVGVPAIGDKVSRAHGVTALFESGRCFFPKAASWMPTLLAELELFPSSAHDDQVDSIVQGLTYLRSRHYDGGLGLLDALKDFFTGKRKMPRSAAEILRSAAINQPKPAVADSFKIWLKTNRAPQCPACQSAATTYNSARRIFCNQCHAENGILPAPPLGSCCDNFVPQIVGGGGIRCGQCGVQIKPVGIIAGQSRAEYFHGVGHRSNFGR